MRFPAFLFLRRSTASGDQLLLRQSLIRYSAKKGNGLRGGGRSQTLGRLSGVIWTIAPNRLSMSALSANWGPGQRPERSLSIGPRFSTGLVLGELIVHGPRSILKSPPRDLVKET